MFPVKFEVWQPDTDTRKGALILFLNSRDLQAMTYWPPLAKDYKMVHEEYDSSLGFFRERYGTGCALEKIYTDLNMNPPPACRTMSVGDILVIEYDRQKEAWFCDSCGFKKLESFKSE